MAHGGSNPTARENRCGRPGGDETGPHSRVSVQAQTSHTQRPPRVGVLCPSLHPLSASGDLTFSPFAPPSRLPHLSRRRRDRHQMGPPTPRPAPALPGPPAPSLCCVGAAGRHWPTLVAPVAPRAAPVSCSVCPFSLSLPLATVLPASHPAHPPHCAPPVPALPPSLPFPTFTPSVSALHSLSHLFLSSTPSSSYHLDTSGSPKGMWRAGPWPHLRTSPARRGQQPSFMAPLSPPGPG